MIDTQDVGTVEGEEGVSFDGVTRHGSPVLGESSQEGWSESLPYGVISLFSHPTPVVPYSFFVPGTRPCSGLSVP